MNTKQRPLQHIMEDQSQIILRNLLPSDWVVHDYRPDYGIDNVIEVFEPCSSDVSESLGELIFMQLKSVKKIKYKQIRLYSDSNDGNNRELLENSDYVDIEVVTQRLNLSELRLIQKIGWAIPVILFLVCIDTKRVFFICLNDYIDKVLLPSNSYDLSQKTYSINIPVGNELTNTKDSAFPLMWYAKRVKLISAFTLFICQFNDLQYMLHPANEDQDEAKISDKLKNTCIHFIVILKGLPLWTDVRKWEIIDHYHHRILELENNLIQESYSITSIYSDIYMLWHGLSNLIDVYEADHRESLLPTWYYAGIINRN